MNIKSRVDKIENQLKLSDIPDLDDRFSDWTDEELEVYATTGIKPENKVIGPISDRAREASIKKYSGWTDEELEIYATTGIKP